MQQVDEAHASPGRVSLRLAEPLPDTALTPPSGASASGGPVLRLAEPLPDAAQAPPSDDQPGIDAKVEKRQGACNRTRQGGCSCLCIVAGVTVCCVLLLAAAAYYYYSYMRNRAQVTLTIGVPATSLSTSLGAGLKCDVAGSLQFAQPPVDFGDIYLESFSLYNLAQEVQVDAYDVRGSWKALPTCAPRL